MKTTLTVLIVLFFGLLIYFRQQVFVRDPLATVWRNDEKQPDAQVYINYSNDVLLMENDYRGSHNTLVQDWNRTPGTPPRLTCIRWTACFTDAEHASSVPLAPTGKGKYDPQVFMTSRQVSYNEPGGANVRITLR